MGDLVSKFEEIELIAISVVAIYLAFRFRSRIIQLVTGDDRIHADGFDSVWYTCCRCCGTCTGDWSRYISCCPCWSACHLHNQNLVDAFGRWSGLLQWQIRVHSIVVGDLPIDSPAYYYVVFEVGEDPPQHTAVSPLSNPKVIKFHGECILRVRDASLDNSVRVVVKEMRTIGSAALCEMYVRPDHLLDWASRPGGTTMRFQLKPCSGADTFLPSWMLMTFDLSKPWEEDLSSPWSEAAISFHGSRGSSDRTFHSVQDLKSSHPLMNEHGIEVREPAEFEVAKFQSLLRTQRGVMRFCRYFVVLLIIASLLFRTAVTTCYREYKRVLVLQQHGVQFPPETRTMNWVLERCGYSPTVSFGDHAKLLEADLRDWQELLGGHNWHDYSEYIGWGPLEDHPMEEVEPNWIDFGGHKRLKVDPNSTACMPERRDVIRLCYNMPIGARSPPFLRGIFRCRPFTCRYRMLLVPISLIWVIVLIVVVVVMYCCHRSNLRQMRQMHKRLVEQAKLTNGSRPNEPVEEDSSFGCCGCGGGVARRQVDLHSALPPRGPPRQALLPQE